MWGVGSKPAFSTSSWIFRRDSPTLASTRRRSTRFSPKTAAWRTSPPAQRQDSPPPPRPAQAAPEVLAEARRLAHLALGPEDAFVPLPPLAVADEPAGEVGDAAREAGVRRRRRL